MTETDGNMKSLGSKYRSLETVAAIPEPPMETTGPYIPEDVRVTAGMLKYYTEDYDVKETHEDGFVVFTAELFNGWASWGAKHAASFADVLSEWQEHVTFHSDHDMSPYPMGSWVRPSKEHALLWFPLDSYGTEYGAHNGVPYAIYKEDEKTYHSAMLLGLGSLLPTGFDMVLLRDKLLRPLHPAQIELATWGRISPEYSHTASGAREMVMAEIDILTDESSSR
jgi:hypothetical protein